MTRHAARWVLTPDGLRENHVVEVSGARIVRVGPAGPHDPAPKPGLLMPGLINAHGHLELSDLEGRVPPGGGFVAWVRRLFGVSRGDDSARIARQAAERMVAAGTAWLWDVSNSGATGGAMAKAGLHGVVQHEVLGFDGPSLHERLAAVRRALEQDQEGPVAVRPSPHAVYSTAPALLQLAASPMPGLGATLHCGESEDEARFLHDGTGPHARLLDDLGRDWRWWRPPGSSAVSYLERLGLLRPDVLLVHGVHFDAADLRRMASAGAPLCLCPRSNRYIGGALPDLAAVASSGVRLCVGTDSLASNTSLDVLQELALLAGHFTVDRLLAMVTSEGADCLGASGYGRLVPGTAPGLLWLDVADPAQVVHDPPAHRRWLAPVEVL